MPKTKKKVEEINHQQTCTKRNIRGSSLTEGKLYQTNVHFTPHKGMKYIASGKYVDKYKN